MTRLPEGRLIFLSSRYRRALATGLGGAAGKAISAFGMLISVPVLLRYLGPDMYGAWTALISSVSLMSFADIGIGSAIINLIAAADGRHDRADMRRVIATSALTFLALCLFVLVLWDIVRPFDVTEMITSGAGLDRDVLKSALDVCVICFALAIPFGLASRVQTALQQGYLASLWLSAGTVMTIGGLLTAVYLKARLPTLALIVAGAPLLAAVTNSLLFFGFQQPDLRPRWQGLSRQTATAISKTSLLFLLLQAGVAVSVASDNIIIARIIGPAAVTAFAVPERLFGLVPMMIYLFLQPLWPAYAAAFARHDHAWAIRTFHRSCLVACLAAVFGCLLLLVFAPTILNLWTSDVVQPSSGLLIGLAVWKLIDSIEYAMTVFLLSQNVLRRQIVLTGLCACVAVLLKVIALHYDNAVEFVPWINAGSRLVITTVPLALLAAKMSKKSPLVSCAT